MSTATTVTVPTVAIVLPLLAVLYAALMVGLLWLWKRYVQRRLVWLFMRRDAAAIGLSREEFWAEMDRAKAPDPETEQP